MGKCWHQRKSCPKHSSQDIDVVQVENILKGCKTQLSRVQRKPFNQLLTVKQVSSHVKNEWPLNIVGAIENWLLGKENSIVLKHVQVINTEGWFRATDDPDFLYGEIKALYKIFKSPLENAGHKENVSTISEQLNAMIKYALQYLDVSKTEYRVVWHKLFDSSKCCEWKSALLLVKLMFTLPVSNAKVERLFSLMSRIKTYARNSLSKIFTFNYCCKVS